MNIKPIIMIEVKGNCDTATDVIKEDDAIEVSQEEEDTGEDEADVLDKNDTNIEVLEDGG